MATLIKTRPSSLNESTLETNIVGEIKEMFDTPFGLFYPIRVRKIFDILPVDFRRFTRRKTKIYRLTPREEGAGGGWDSKLVIPRAFGLDDRVIYIQFKSGEHSEGNSVPNSMFNFRIKNPNRHIEFSFNDNDKPSKGKQATQHDDLKRLNDHLVNNGFSSYSVIYAFPRITSLDEFDRMTEPLILNTTFISVDQMDAEAKNVGSNLHDGKRHYFRTCYVDESKREISSTPFRVKADPTIDVIEEIMLVKLFRLWNEYREKINEKRLKDYLNLSAALFLNVNPFKILNRPFEFFDFKDEDFRSLFGQFEPSNKVLNVNLFRRISLAVNGVRGEVDINNDVPSKFTNPISRAYAPSSFDRGVGEISVSAVVF